MTTWESFSFVKLNLDSEHELTPDSFVEYFGSPEV